MKLRLAASAACLVCLAPAVPASAQVPVYASFELQARTNLIVNDNGFNLPPGASFNSITVDMNDVAQVTFKVQVVPGRDGMSIWSGSGGIGELVCDAEDNFDALVSDPKINSAGAIVFRQSFSDLDGVYSCNAGTGEVVRVTAGPIGASSWDTPEINDAGQIGYRAGFAGSGQAWVSLDGSSFAFHATEIGIDVNSLYDFLFTPSFDNLRRMAGVVRRADADSANREIRLFDSEGESTLIARNTVLDPTSPYASFDNSVGLNDAGQVAFIAASAGVRAVFRSDGAQTTEIARVGVAGLTGVEFFAPAINAGGLVAFRGTDANGQAIFVGDGKTLLRVIGRGDMVTTDQGEGQIGQHDDSPVFGGGVAINDNGDIAFTASLHPAGNNQVEWGTGVFVAYAEIDDDTIFADGFEVLPP